MLPSGVDGWIHHPRPVCRFAADFRHTFVISRHRDEALRGGSRGLWQVDLEALERTGNGGYAFKTLRDSLGGAILLGLELLVAAGIVKTVTSTPY